MVRYRMSDYSVPTAYGFREVVVKGFVDQVVMFCGGEEIARHRRSYERGSFICDPLHYLLGRHCPGTRSLQAARMPQLFRRVRLWPGLN
jgi:hypothetical protein